MDERLRCVLVGAIMGAASEAPQRSGYVAEDEDGPMEAVQRPGYCDPGSTRWRA